MAEYDKYPIIRHKMLRGIGNSVDPCILLFFSFETLWGGKKKQEKVHEGNRIWVALIMDKENFNR